MVKYRRRFEIIADILKAAENGAKKTRIMYVANLSYKLLNKYLIKTINVGFIRPNNDSYEITEKGRLFLEMYAQFSSKYSRLQRELETLKFEIEVLERMCTANNANIKMSVRREGRSERRI
ncbi:MAG: winged helix-turn-helix domain-containing protein [Candidatus Bathyarchaeia archaeon]